MKTSNNGRILGGIGGIWSRGLMGIACAAVLGMAESSKGALQNPMFEDGLSGWQQANTSYTFVGATEETDLAESVAEHQPSQGGLSATFYPQIGSRFLQLRAGPADVWVTVSQTVGLTDDQVLRGYAAFSAYDDSSLSYNDTAAVWITRLVAGSEVPVAVLWQKSIADVGSQGHSGWENWSFAASTPGEYTLYFGAKNVGDDWDKASSYALFAAVPEPSTMIAGGLLLLVMALSVLLPRRKLQQVH